MKSKWTMAATLALAAFLGLAGCSGDDGRDGAEGERGPEGPRGEQGPEGPPGENVVVTPVESCAVCHGSGTFADANANHALPPIETYGPLTFAVNGLDLDVTFDLFADGAPATGYDRVERGYKNAGTTEIDICNAPSRNDPCDAASLTLIDNGDGNYTVKVLGGAADAATDHRYLFRVAAGTDRETRVYVYGDTPLSPFAPVQVTVESCMNCHGPEPIGIHGGYYAAQDGGEPCLVCHGSDTVDEPGVIVPSLAAVTHQYHSGLYGEITYPTYMTNCSVCHQTEDQLAAVNALPVVAEACFSCHGTTATMFEDPASPLATLHANIVDNCDSCHVAGGVGAALLTVTDAHNGLRTGRDGIIWDGVDTSVVEGDKISWLITDVVDDGTNLEISWTASYEGVGVDPCNATAGPTAPVFFADGSGNLSILRNYSQGGDYILGTNPNAAGQPSGQVNVSAANTTCAQGVATTVVPVEATDAMYGRVAIQGKPRLPSVEDPAALMAVRAFTPTFDWVVGEGGAAPARRPVVDSGLCLKCHVGSMYQHGGNRVDNVDMCYLCHNTAANDEFVRTVNFGGVDATESYDGRAGQNFGMKEMLHAVHSAGATGAPIVIYRGRGIYAWAGSEDLLPNWNDAEDCVLNSGAPGKIVFGSDPATATSNPCQPHIFHTPTYPRALNDCAACHVEGLNILPRADVAMASTVAGAADGNQLDDVLEGALASSCMTCHRSDDRAVEAALKAHAYQNGWVPQDFPEGRQTIIEAIK